MKRQRSLTEFFNRKPRSGPVVSELALDDAKPSQTKSPQLGDNGASIEIDSSEMENSQFFIPKYSEIENSLPECWTVRQYNSFKGKYDGLVVSNKKLGCEYCSKYDFAKEEHLHVSEEWKHSQIVAAGKSKRIQESSLRKQMEEHFSSKAHTICRDNIKGEQEAVTTAADEVAETDISRTCRVFNIVYSLAKRCGPLSYFESMVETSIAIGADMGVGLHSHQAALKIVDFIAKEMRKNIFTKVIEKDLKICLIVDEDLTLSWKPVIMLFLEVEGSVSLPTLFVELVELEKEDAETVFSSAMESLYNFGFTEKYMEKNLIGFRANGASALLGRKSGVRARIAREFPNITKDSNEDAIPGCVRKAKNIVRKIVVNATRGEAAFLAMNSRGSERINRLTVSNIASIMTVRLINLPIENWDETPIVKKWLQEYPTLPDVEINLEESEGAEDAHQAVVWEYCI